MAIKKITANRVIATTDIREKLETRTINSFVCFLELYDSTTNFFDHGIKQMLQIYDSGHIPFFGITHYKNKKVNS